MIPSEQQRMQLEALDPDELIAEARRRAGLTDFGDESFLIPSRKPAGLFRCGTTRTHRSIGSDPHVLKTNMWQVLNFASLPDALPGEPDPDRRGGSGPPAVGRPL